jgi:hypothetical protein
VIQAGLAAAAMAAGLMGQQAKARDDKKREDREKEAFKRQQIAGILQNRAAVAGVDTQQSQLENDEQNFLRQLASQRRDTSGDWLPFVQGAASLAQGVAGDIASKPTAAAPMSKETLAPTFQQYGNRPEDEQSFLMRLARKGGF